jgi:hypothetical protein
VIVFPVAGAHVELYLLKAVGVYVLVFAFSFNIVDFTVFSYITMTVQ